MNRIRLGFWVGASGWLLLAGWFAWQIMLVAWGHNPQGEFHDCQTGKVNWGDWFAIGAAWFWALGLIPVGLLGLIVYGATRRKTVDYEPSSESIDP